jgi:uncharacterized peroxidase-related enzyme
MGTARIPVITEAQATGETAELYAEIKERFGIGAVPDVFMLTGARPEFLRVFWDGYKAMFYEGVLPRELKEMVATIVSQANSCRFCTQAHSLLLRSVGGTADAAAAAAIGDIESLPVGDKEKGLLRLAKKVTEAAYKVSDEDFAELQSLGATHSEILELVFVASLFNAINRLADTFGLYEVMQLQEVAVAEGGGK